MEVWNIEYLKCWDGSLLNEKVIQIRFYITMTCSLTLFKPYSIFQHLYLYTYMHVLLVKTTCRRTYICTIYMFTLFKLLNASSKNLSQPAVQGNAEFVMVCALLSVKGLDIIQITVCWRPCSLIASLVRQVTQGHVNLLHE